MSFDRWFLRFFSFYLIFGNLLRLIPGGSLTGGILVTEVILYLFGFVAFLMVGAYIVPLTSLLVLLLFSTCYGMLQNGFNITAHMYAFRLVALVMVGLYLGRLLYLKFGDSVEKFCAYFTQIYLIQSLIGFIIFFVFKNSVDLWLFFELLGMTYRGDPHYGRFISTYLDPNFFSVIAIIPIIFSVYLIRVSDHPKNKWKLIVFALALCLTFSRSGIASFLAVLIFICFYYFVFHYYFVLKASFVRLMLSFIAIMGAALTACYEQIAYFVNRFIHMNVDPSALGRLEVFEIGVDIGKEHPLFGIGYNYIPVFIENFLGLTALDSSIQNTIVSFGILPTSIFFLCFVFGSISYLRKAKKMSFEFRSLFTIFYFYILVCVFFASQFNNLLYYQFWLVPVIATFTYFSRCIRKASVLNVLKDEKLAASCR